MANANNTTPPPNILLITCDQYQFPRFAYGPDGGMVQDLKDILGFVETLSPDNPFLKFFPGLLKLRKNAVVLTNHTIAASACTPSRGTIYTGQYGTRTGVTQTDGLFKDENDVYFPWLKAGTIPTLGHWLRQAGYSTHYFGKWHVSNPPDHSLDEYGFDDWELSYPEPHGASGNNLGMYRDFGFADSACNFLMRKGLAVDYDRRSSEFAKTNPNATQSNPPYSQPWFAVASFTNPHDIATYPAVVSQALPADSQQQAIANLFNSLDVPAAGSLSPPPTLGTYRINLNPLDFPQNCANNTPTWDEALDTKPSCQWEYAYKMGIALSAKLGYSFAQAPQLSDAAYTKLAVEITRKSVLPFPLSPAQSPEAATLAFIQFYTYLHTVLDPHIDRVLTALEDSGQADNTIVVFLTDHGEYAGAHGMLMEKWHGIYQEALHVPVVVSWPDALLPPALQGTQDDTGLGQVRQLDGLTSHIDILPTILGLAGIDRSYRNAIQNILWQQFTQMADLPGIDLSPYLRGEIPQVLDNDGNPRQGVLFITNDQITEPVATPPGQPVDPHTLQSLQQFAVFNATVENVINTVPACATLTPGPVKQPNNIHCVRSQRYKLARYFDPNNANLLEWEMYDLDNDPNETINLVQVAGPAPVPISNLPEWADPSTLPTTIADLQKLLDSLEQRCL